MIMSDNDDSAQPIIPGGSKMATSDAGAEINEAGIEKTEAKSSAAGATPFMLPDWLKDEPASAPGGEKPAADNASMDPTPVEPAPVTDVPPDSPVADGSALLPDPVIPAAVSGGVPSSAGADMDTPGNFQPPQPDQPSEVTQEPQPDQSPEAAPASGPDLSLDEVMALFNSDEQNDSLVATSGIAASTQLPTASASTVSSPENVPSPTASAYVPLAGAIAEQKESQVQVPENVSTPELQAPEVISQQIAQPAADKPQMKLPKVDASKLLTGLGANVSGAVTSLSNPKTKRNISITIIFLLLIVVLVESLMIIHLGTNGQPKVYLLAGEGSETISSQKTSQANSVSVSSSQTVAVDGEVDIYVYMLALAADSPTGAVDESGLPAGAVALGQGDFIVKMLYQQGVKTDQPVATALESLLGIDSATFGADGYRNFLSRSELKVSVNLIGAGENETLQIDLVGDFQVPLLSDYEYAKQQLERTIENYTFNYRIRLNGSEQLYQCTGMEDVEACMQEGAIVSSASSVEGE